MFLVPMKNIRNMKNNKEFRKEKFPGVDEVCDLGYCQK